MTRYYRIRNFESYWLLQFLLSVNGAFEWFNALMNVDNSSIHEANWCKYSQSCILFLIGPRHNPHLSASFMGTSERYVPLSRACKI